MGYVFGNSTSGTKRGGYVFGGDDTTGSNGTQTAIRNYETRIAATGNKPPEPKKEQGALLKILDILDRPRNAVVNAIQDTTTGENNFLTGLAQGFTGKEKAYTSDLLKQAGVKNKAALAIGGFLGDVALDPSTYLTLGGGAAIKTAAKAGAGALAKTGVPAAIRATGAGQKVEQLGQSLGKVFVPGFGLPEEYNALRKGYVQDLGYLRNKKMDYLADVRKRFSLTADETKLVQEGLEKPISLKGADQRIVGATRELRGMFKRGIKEEQQVLGPKVKERSNYAPHVRMDTGELMPKGATSSPLRPNDRFTKGRKIEGTTAEINKQMGKDFFDPNAITAAAVREYSRLGGVQTKKFIDETLTQFGQKVKPGYKAGADEGIYTVQNFKLYPVEDVYGSIHQAFSKQVPTFALPKEIADDLNTFYTTFVNDKGTKEFLRLFDKTQNVWKGIVTAPNPAFHIRNALGNMWNNYLAGVNNPQRYTQAAQIQKGTNAAYTLGGKKYTGKQLLDMAEKEGILGYGQFGADLPSTVRGLMDEKAGKFTLNPVKLGRRAGNSIEDNAKIAHFIDKLAKGDDVKTAAQSVKKYLFDYSDLTVAEKNVFRRVAPFYTFWRKNLPLQLEHLFAQPGKYTGVQHLTENAANVAGVDNELLPEWMKEQGAIALGNTKEGKQRLLTLGLPMSDVNSLNLRDLLSRVSPALRTPFELATNQQIYSGAPIEKYEGEQKKLLGMDLPARMAYLLAQTGVTRAPAAYLGSIMEPGATTQKTPIVSSFIRELDPKKQKEIAAYDRRQQLADFVRALEAQGVDVATINELKGTKSGKRGGYVF